MKRQKKNKKKFDPTSHQLHKFFKLQLQRKIPDVSRNIYSYELIFHPCLKNDHTQLLGIILSLKLIKKQELRF